MTNTRDCHRYELIVMLGVIALSWQPKSAEHSTPSQDGPHGTPAAESTPAPAKPAKAAELPGDLTIGKSTNDNLAFKSMPE